MTGGRWVSVLRGVVHWWAGGRDHSRSLAGVYWWCTTPGLGYAWVVTGGYRWPGLVRVRTYMGKGMAICLRDSSLGGYWGKDIFVLGLVGCGVASAMSLVEGHVALGPGWLV